MYGNRNAYRETITTKDLVFFSVTHRETDVYIGAEKDFAETALLVIRELRRQLDEYINKNPGFSALLAPVRAKKYAPEIVKRMCHAAALAKVGPMAAVAGAFSELTGRALSDRSEEILVENGGDIYLKTGRSRVIAVYAGESPLSLKIGVQVRPADTPVGICTSAGTVGHSKSLGRADAAVVVAKDTCLADAAATRLGNLIQKPNDIGAALEQVVRIRGVRGALGIIGDSAGAVGDIQIKTL